MKSISNEEINKLFHHHLKTNQKPMQQLSASICLLNLIGQFAIIRGVYRSYRTIAISIALNATCIKVGHFDGWGDLNEWLACFINCHIVMFPVVLKAYASLASFSYASYSKYYHETGQFHSFDFGLFFFIFQFITI